jgi:hypothetical protein
VSYGSSKSLLTANFENLLQLRGFNSKFKILLTTIFFYFSQFTSYSVFKFSSSVLTSSASKLSELFLLDQKLIASFQKGCVVNLLYPLIFKTAKTNSALIGASLATLKSVSTASSKSKVLKALSV